MFDYDFNGEQKHTMIVGHFSYYHYRLNIIYEDYEGSDEKCFISTNLCDFFDSLEDFTKIKNVFIKMLKEDLQKEYMDVKWKVPQWLQKYILQKVENIKYK